MTSAPQPVRRVVVVGGGIAGLAAGRLLAQDADTEVLLFEAADRVGGKLRLGEVAGVPVDLGAESVLNRRPEGVDLIRSTGLGDDLVHPDTIAARIWSHGALRPLPRSVMGVPASEAELRASGVLSERGLARALREPDLPASAVDGDVSVGALVEERFGSEVVDRLVEPLLGGVYAGHARSLSLHATVPQVAALLDEDASLLRAAQRSVARRPVEDVPVFAGVVGGVGRLPQAVVASTPDLHCRTGTTVRALRRTPTGWALAVGPTTAEEQIEADAVVLAVPAAAAARLLGDAVPTAAAELGAVEHASMAVVTLAFRADDVPDVVGSGFLVPPVERRTVKAATYSFQKWPWVADAGSGEGLRVLRTSVGRHREEAALQHADEDIVAAALADLRDLVGVRGEPVEATVTRWGGGLPQYAVGHRERVARVRAAVAQVPGLAVCGAAYDGLGIPACIASADLAVQEVRAHLDLLASRAGAG